MPEPRRSGVGLSCSPAYRASAAPRFPFIIPAHAATPSTQVPLTA